MRTLRIFAIVLSFVLLLSACPLQAVAVSDPTGEEAPLPECFQQTDSRWADRELIGPNGCGLISLVNAVNYLTGNFIDPVELAVYAHRIDAYNGSVGGGTARWVLYNKLSRYERKYGFKVTNTGEDAGVRNREFIRHLENGGAAVCHVYGHFIAIVDYDAKSNSYLVYDSAANPSRRRTEAKATWLDAAYLSASTYMTVDWWCLLERTSDSRNRMGDRIRENQPVEMYRHIERDEPLELAGTAFASGGIRSLFYTIDYDFDHMITLTDTLQGAPDTETPFSVSIDLSQVPAGMHTLRLSARGEGGVVSDIAVCTLYVGDGTDGGTDPATGDASIGFSGYTGLSCIVSRPSVFGMKSPCCQLSAGTVLSLGEMDLSNFTSVEILFSTRESFHAGGEDGPACLGLKSVATDFGSGNTEYNVEGSLSFAVLESGSGGLERESRALLDLSDVTYAGQIFLTAFIPGKQPIFVRGLRFYTGGTADTETATVTQTEPEEPSAPATETATEADTEVAASDGSATSGIATDQAKSSPVGGCRSALTTTHVFLVTSMFLAGICLCPVSVHMRRRKTKSDTPCSPL